MTAGATVAAAAASASSRARRPLPERPASELAWSPTHRQALEEDDDV